MRYVVFAGAMVVAMMGLAAACSESEPPAAGTETPEDVAEVTQSFALTPECAQCAGTAVSGVCGAAAQACLQDPLCADVAGCVQACPPGDPMCIANCWNNASNLLDVLADCVVCQECTVECAGAWTCGGGVGGGGGAAPGAGGMAAPGGSGGTAPGGGTCDNTGICQACIGCAVAGPCQAVIQACLSDPMCIGDPVQMEAAFKCAACTECANDCAGTASPLPGVSCP